MIDIFHKISYYIIGAVMFLVVIGGILNVVGYPIYYNSTESLPQKIFIAKKNYKEIKKGDYVVIDHDGDRHIKFVAGVGGDKVSVVQGMIFVAGENVGQFYQDTEGLKMTITPVEGDFIIPRGFLYVAGTHPKSYDSRYKEYGLVPLKDIIGIACPIF